VRYQAAYWATRLTTAQATPLLQSTLVKMLTSNRELPGTIGWAERAVAHIAPHPAVIFEELERRGKPVSADAWIAVGPAGLEHFRRTAKRESFEDWVAMSAIVQAAPDAPESIETIPLLLTGMEASDPWKSVAIRALEAMGSQLATRLTNELHHAGSSTRRQAALALGLMRCDADSASADLEATAHADRDATVRRAASQAAEQIHSACAAQDPK